MTLCISTRKEVNMTYYEFCERYGFTPGSRESKIAWREYKEFLYS